MRPGPARRRSDRRHRTHDGLNIQRMAGLRVRMDAVRSENKLLPERASLRLSLRERCGPENFPRPGQPCDLQPEVDGGNPIPIRHTLHRARRTGELAIDERRSQRLGQGVDEADVAPWGGPPGLPDNSLHAADDLLGRRAGVVDRELDEQQIGLPVQDVVPEPKDAEIGASAADRGVDLGESRRRVALLKVFERPGSPALLRRDRAAEIADANIRAALPRFCQKVGQAATRAALRGRHERKLLRGFTLHLLRFHFPAPLPSLPIH